MVRAFVTSLPAFVLAVLLLSAARPSANAAITVLAPTSSTNGSFTITEDITFTIRTGVASTNLIFSLDDWIPYDGISNPIPTYSPQLLLSFNGAAPQTYGGGVFRDNVGSSGGEVTADDGYFSVSGTGIPSLAVGDTVTIKAATYSIGMVRDFDPRATQTFTGNMFITISTGARISDIVTVPEPGSAALFVGGLTLLGLRRRR